MNFYPEETFKPIADLDKSKRPVLPNSGVKTKADASPSISAYLPGQINDEQESTRRGVNQDLNNTGTFSSKTLFK